MVAALLILDVHKKRWLQRACIVCWTILFAIPLWNNLTSNAESWLALCTQKGIELISLEELSQSKDHHEVKSCACSSELSEQRYNGSLLRLQPSQVARDYYAFKPWLYSYRPQSPRGPPV